MVLGMYGLAKQRVGDVSFAQQAGYFVVGEGGERCDVRETLLLHPMYFMLNAGCWKVVNCSRQFAMSILNVTTDLAFDR